MDSQSIWNVIELYFKGKHLEQLVRHQLESYNYFINEQMEKTIMMFNPIIIKMNLQDKHTYTKQPTQTFDMSKATTSIKLDTYHNIKIEITFQNYSLYRPQIHENNGSAKIMFPEEARSRNFTYSSNITVDVNIKYVVTQKNEGEEATTQIFNKILPNITIGKMPIMLKSDGCILKQYRHFSTDTTNECKYDPGGYFIINGSEKTILAQERSAENKIYLFEQNKLNSKFLYYAEIKSVPSDKCISPKHITMFINSKKNEYGYTIHVQIPRLRQPVPLFVLFRALGITSDKEICTKVLLDVNATDSVTKKILEFLKGSVFESSQCLTQEKAITIITSHAIFVPLNMDKETGNRKKQDYAKEILNVDLFPHSVTTEDKIYFLGYMANKLIKGFLKMLPQNDRDSYENKRLDTGGMLLNNLLRNYFNKLVKDMQKSIIREINTGSWRSTFKYDNIVNYTNIYKIIKSITIENGIKRALSTGDFGIKNMNSNKVGVAQVLNRMTYISALSHLRRINTPIDKSGKLIPPRQLHPSSWGFLCPVETPEGQSVGVVKNLSFMAHVTIASSSKPLFDFVLPYLHHISASIDNNKCIKNHVKVFINGRWVGVAKDPFTFYNALKKSKHDGIINIYTSIVFIHAKQEIYICNEAGRICRPLFRVRDNKLLVTDEIIQQLKEKRLDWNDLLVSQKLPEAILEYLDADEQMHMHIAMKLSDLSDNGHLHKQYTHCELHPSTIFGVLASCIPYPHHNQSPRLTYQCAMGKQAMGIYVTNYNVRMDKTSYVLTYPTRPLVDTRLMNIININNVPSGCQVIVAIMTHMGYNQEDSIIFNRGSIDRGLFHATVYHTEKDEDKKINGDEEVRCKPNKEKTKGMRFANYNKLNADGLVSVNTFVEDRDIIIGKVFPIKENRNDNTKKIKYTDQSRSYRTDEPCYVDKVYLHRNGDGYKFSKVKIRISRKPVIGDKFSSRGAQKGTIGAILNEDDMPFTSSGLRPDIIINPHCIPSRMTIGQLKETLLGKVLLELGLFGDGTSFTDLSLDTIRNELIRNHYNSNGDEIMYNGITGEQISMPIFIGPTFYQRLKHMVNDKCHSRNIGPMVSLTRQPAEGRSRDGGLRFGEMERDCMISHGTSTFIQKRMYDCSDKYEVHVCKQCGMIACYNDEKHIHKCNLCENTVDFALVKLPYACKLMFHELMTMNIAPRIVIDSS